MTQYRVAMDIGGTFTDVVTYDEAAGVFTAGKASDHAGQSVRWGAGRSRSGGRPSAADIAFLVHGTTQGLNAFLERRGVPGAAAGHRRGRGRYHIARGPRTRLVRPALPQADAARPATRRGRHRRAGSAYDGTELDPLDEEAVRWPRRARRERRARRDRGRVPVQLRQPGARAAGPGDHPARNWARTSPSRCRTRRPRSGASTSAPSSAVVEAYTGPIVRRYLLDSEQRLTDHGLPSRCTSCSPSGGILTAESARREPLQTLLSGPVGGAIACAELSRVTGRPHLIGVDMGGTSASTSR